MPRKPGRMYREIRMQAYCQKKYMGGVPAPRITQFDMGKANKDFDLTLSLVAEERCQVRHISLEAARIAVNRELSEGAGLEGFHMKVRVFPHVVLRENKQATGAGADRVSQGMRAAFGKAVGTAARVEVGQRLITVRVNKEHLNVAKLALRRGSTKLPTPTRTIIEKGAELVR
jgi:large subunit ribosomal protein L10e